MTEYQFHEIMRALRRIEERLGGVGTYRTPLEREKEQDELQEYRKRRKREQLRAPIPRMKLR